MSEQQPREEGRPELPIERGFPIERVNEIAEKESRAKQWYRPIYAMHKWWARRPGCLFRAISLYSLVDEDTTPAEVNVYEPGENQQLANSGLDEDGLIEAIGNVDMDDPESLWDFYPKDVRIKDKKILDPFMGGGTSLVEASRFGVDSVGRDLNPVAWFVSKKEIEAGQTNPDELKKAFEQVREDVAESITQYYRTPCPNGNHKADVMYNFWVKELDCVSCGQTVGLFKDYRVAKGRYENDELYNVLCPDCGEVVLVDDWQDTCSCTECNHKFTPKSGNVSHSNYSCPDCGQKYGITDAVQEQGGYNHRLYAIEYYCSKCDSDGLQKSKYKGYKAVEEKDKEIVSDAFEEWDSTPHLHDYVPQESIPEGASTIVRPDVSYDGHDVFNHGFERWTDMYNKRQLLSLSKILESIEKIPDQNHREFLLLALSSSLRYSNMMVGYHHTRNHIHDAFKTNSFDSANKPVEGNVWGTEFGLGTFESMFEGVLRGVEYANSPTDRHLKDGKMVETAPFSQPVGENSEVHQGDVRSLEAENEYDAVITDPPYYDNVIYSELSDYFYVWQKVLLESEYECFEPDKTPRAESIVTNPYLNKTAEDFEHEMGQALQVIKRALKDEGTLAFTYHHSDSESWGELLESLCNTGFEVTATYPINSDLNKFTDGEAVTFDIAIVARPADESSPISWNSLRRRIHKTAQDTRETLEETRDLSSGDIGVIEMGKCFQEYSKHHGEVRRAGEIISAKDVVGEIYGIIQDTDRGEQDIYLDLLEEHRPTYDDLNKHLRRSDASEEQMREMQLFRMAGGDFFICQWDDENRQAYVQSKVEESNSDLTMLDKAHYLRYRFELGKSTGDYLEKWSEDKLQELCEGLAEVTGDETYLKMIGVDTSLAEFGGE